MWNAIVTAVIGWPCNGHKLDRSFFFLGKLLCLHVKAWFKMEHRFVCLFFWHQQIQGAVQLGKYFTFKPSVLNCLLKILLKSLIISCPFISWYWWNLTWQSWYLLFLCQQTTVFKIYESQCQSDCSIPYSKSTLTSPMTAWIT